MILSKIDTESVLKISSVLIEDCSSSMREIITTYGADFFFDFNERKNIFYLEKGRVSIKDKINNKILYTVDAPYLIGIDNLFKSNEIHYLSSDSNCRLFSFEKECVLKSISKNNLWCDVSKILCDLIDMHDMREVLFYHSNIYTIIKFHLEKIYMLPESERLNISLFDFILNRTSISRSSLNKIVKQLEFGGYIKTKRGVLIEVKKLPNNF